MKCPKCGRSVLDCVSLRGKSQLLDAVPDYSRGDYLIAAANGAKATARMAIHVSHFDTETQRHAEAAGLRLYRTHYASCPQGEWRRRAQGEAA